MRSTKKRSLSAAIFSLFLIIPILVGCEEEVIKYIDQTPGADGRVIGSVHGIVKEAPTNTTLDSIRVNWVVNGGVNTTYTDSNGLYGITDLSSGDYEISFTTESYTNRKFDIHIPTLREIGVASPPTGKDFEHSQTMDVDLYGMNAGLKGVVYIKKDEENTKLADGVQIIADFTDHNILPDEHIAATDSNGVFSFKDLPATPDVDLRTVPYSDGINNYGVKTTTVALTSNKTSDAGNLILDKVPETPFIVQNNFENDEFIITDNIIITFSKLMDPNSFDIDLSSNTYGNVEHDVTWSNNITMNIDPHAVLQANETYILILNGKSKDNNAFIQTMDFETQEGIKFNSTNLERVDGVFDNFPVDSNIEMTFSMEVDLDNYKGYVNLYDEPEGTLVSTTLSNNSTTLVIDPFNNLEPDNDYRLDYKVYSSIEGDYDEREINFRTASDVTSPPQVTGFIKNMGEDWSADWNTTSISFKWNTVENVDSYRIYAKDNNNNTDLIKVAAVDDQDYVNKLTTTVDLSSYPQFDYFEDDGIQTPFTNGTELTFVIEAKNIAGEGPLSNEVIIKDNTPPEISILQNGSADNTTGLNPEFSIYIDNSPIEYADASDNPTFTFVEDGGDPDYVLPRSAVEWVWSNDRRNGEATVNVPEGENGSGDMLIIEIEDNSGNISVPDTLNLF